MREKQFWQKTSFDNMNFQVQNVHHKSFASSKNKKAARVWHHVAQQ